MHYFKDLPVIFINILVRKTIKFIRDSRDLARGSSRRPLDCYAGLLTTGLRVRSDGVELLVHF